MGIFDLILFKVIYDLHIENIHIKQNPRPKLMEEIRQDHNLKHIKPTDKSAPIIESL